MFVQRRAPDRKVLAGLWDLVGGHVERGETLLAALSREVGEESGWALRGTPRLIHVADWETTDAAVTHRRREFDFLVEVDGDLDHPRLEAGKHVDHRWIGRANLALLDENAGRDEGLIRRVVELALSIAARPQPQANEPPRPQSPEPPVDSDASSRQLAAGEA